MAKRIKDVIIPALPAVLALLLLQSGIIHRILGIKVLQLPLPFDIAAASNIKKKGLIKMKIKKFLGVILVLSLIAGLISGCGKKESVAETGNDLKELDKITVQSLWLPQGQFAGLYVADEKGFYEEEGIDV